MLGADVYAHDGRKALEALGYNKSPNANAAVSGRDQEERKGRDGFYVLLNVVIEIDPKHRGACQKFCV